MEKLSQQSFWYELPDERIARFPVEPRDHARLLYYHQGDISNHRFYELPDILPADTILIFNNTKVIPARLYFHTETGAKVELLLLEQQKSADTWHCLIGNVKKWKEGQPLISEKEIQGNPIKLEARLKQKDPPVVQFVWDERSYTFPEILALFGAMPIPPYLKREADESDKKHYQTVYARYEGAVAAPTAGLHFTDQVLQNLGNKGIPTLFLTLHVGAGTFLPVKTKDDITQHPMHAEHFYIPAETLQALLNRHQPIIAVGTTTVRALESAYWAGVKLLKHMPRERFIEKLLPYQFETEALPSRSDSFQALLTALKHTGESGLQATTEIMIFPGYTFKTIDGMITNFHQPGSTLIMLIAAFVGQAWKRIYTYALQHDYRFLSYGDSSLLIP